MYITGSTRLREGKIDPGRFHRGDRDYGKNQER